METLKLLEFFVEMWESSNLGKWLQTGRVSSVAESLIS